MGIRTYIFAGGGTGGHLMPALAVAEELLRIEPQAKLAFACSDREIDRRILSATPYAFVPQPIRPFPRGLRGWGAFLAGWRRSGRLAADLVRDLKPAAVLGLGGFAAVPVVRRSARAGIRLGMTSIDAVPGLANRFVAGQVQAIFAQFETTAAAYGRHAGKVRLVGCPVRAAILSARREPALAELGLDAGRRTLLVMAGSLGAANINQAMLGVLPDLAALPDWQVLHVAGPGKLEQIGDAYRQAGVPAVVMEFCQRMDLAYAAADLALCRAGASTIAELAATLTPAVLMPYPYHRDQHQRHNAAALVQAGSAIEAVDVKDHAANAQALRQRMLPVMRDAGVLAAMRDSAGRTARPDAAAAIARWMLGGS